MKLKNIICITAACVLLFSQTAFAAQQTQQDAVTEEAVPQTEGAASSEMPPAAQDGEMAQDFGGRMPGRGGMGRPGEIAQDNMMRGEMPQGRRDMGQGFDAAVQNEMMQGSNAEESFVDKHFTFIVSVAVLILGFLFVILYKRKTF